MRRITMWITATLAVLALVVAYQLNAAGVGGKDGGDQDGRSPAACATAGTAPSSCPPSASTMPSVGATPPASGSASPSAMPAASGSPDDDGKTGGTEDDHSDKPGESK